MSIFPQEETLYIEFKSDVKKVSDQELIEAVVAFANTKGGSIYIGIEDDGRITGIHEQHQNNIIGLGAMIANHTVPPQTVRIELISCPLPVVKIEVSISRTTVASSSGKILRRRMKVDGTPENVPLYPHEINARLAELGQLDYSAQPVAGAVYEDLDSTERQRLRKVLALQRGEMNLLELSDEELDQALRLVKSVDGVLVPTVTGLLLIGKSERIRELLPTAEVAFQVLMGTEIKLNDSGIKPILSLFEKFDEYMSAWNPERELEYGLIRMSVPEFDKRAFREAVVNAICHRDYTILRRTLILIDDNGLSISNPGGFIEGISADNLLSAEPHGRNPALADALKRIGLAERTGRGIDRIFEGSLVYGRPLPDYSDSNSISVKLFIPRAKPDKSFIEMIAAHQNKSGQSLSITSLLILSELKQQRRASLHHLASSIHLSDARARAAIEMLIEAGLIEAIGNGKSRNYILSSGAYKASGDPMGYIRQKDIDSIRYEELIMNLINKQGYVTRSNVVSLLHISESTAYKLLKSMAEHGKLKLGSKGKYAKYFVK